MTILITGVSGLVGAHLCKTLMDMGYSVIGLAHTRTNPIIDALYGTNGFQLQSCDIRDSFALNAIVRDNKVKTVFHLAAHLPYTPDKDLTGVNAVGMNNLVKVILDNDVQELVYASSMSVYSTPPRYLPVSEGYSTVPDSPYGLTKLVGEEACFALPNWIKATVVRYAGVYGQGNEKDRVIARFVRQALINQPLVVDGDGSHSSDFVYVEDIVQGTILAWLDGNSSEVYNIGSGRDTSLLDLATVIVRLTDSKSEVVVRGTGVTRPFRFYLDITKIRGLGYTPYTLEAGLTAYIRSVCGE